MRAAEGEQTVEVGSALPALLLIHAHGAHEDARHEAATVRVSWPLRGLCAAQAAHNGTAKSNGFTPFAMSPADDGDSWEGVSEHVGVKEWRCLVRRQRLLPIHRLLPDSQ